MGKMKDNLDQAEVRSFNCILSHSSTSLTLGLPQFPPLTLGLSAPKIIFLSSDRDHLFIVIPIRPLLATAVSGSMFGGCTGGSIHH